MRYAALHNQEAVSQYLNDWLAWSQQQWKAQQINPTPTMLRLRQLRAERKAKNKANEPQVSSR